MCSDARLKRNISPRQNSLQRIVQLNGYTYQWKNEQPGTRLRTGVLAQRVQKLFPQLVTEDNKGMPSVNYSGLIPVLIEIAKEQQDLIE
jgi:Chaperone of endosialidase